MQSLQRRWRDYNISIPPSSRFEVFHFFLVTTGFRHRSLFVILLSLLTLSCILTFFVSYCITAASFWQFCNKQIRYDMMCCFRQHLLHIFFRKSHFSQWTRISKVENSLSNVWFSAVSFCHTYIQISLHLFLTLMYHTLSSGSTYIIAEMRMFIMRMIADIANWNWFTESVTNMPSVPWLCWLRASYL